MIFFKGSLSNLSHMRQNIGKVSFYSLSLSILVMSFLILFYWLGKSFSISSGHSKLRSLMGLSFLNQWTYIVYSSCSQLKKEEDAIRRFLSIEISLPHGFHIILLYASSIFFSPCMPLYLFRYFKSHTLFWKLSHNYYIVASFELLS
jgi:hypothetical protein